MIASHNSQSDSSPETLRLFVAIQVSDNVRQTLRRVQAHLRQRDSRSMVRWIELENWHLTLQFLGETSSKALPSLVSVLASTALQTAPFALHLDNGGCFPSPRRPRAFWVGVEGDLSALYFLQRQISANLAAWIGRAEPFQPHLTLGRTKTSRHGKAPQTMMELANFLPQMLISPTSWQVVGFDLMQSQLTPQGAIYSTLASFPLGSTL